MTQMNKRPAPARQRPQPAPRMHGADPRQMRSVQRTPNGARRQAPSRRKPPSPNHGGYKTKIRLPLLLVGGLAAIVLAFFLQCAWPNGFPLTKNTGNLSMKRMPEIHADGPLRINEVACSNRGSYTAADATTPDWIEIINTGDQTVNLGGYMLAKSEKQKSVFTFPQMELASGACVMVLADSRLREEAGQELHAPFRLSGSGDVLMLFNEGGTAVDTVNLPSMTAEQSYARVSKESWALSDRPTPGQANTDAGYQALTEADAQSPVILTELVASNRSLRKDENNLNVDYIQLTNRTSAAVDLTGWSLSDDPLTPRKWLFPAVQIEPGENLVVFASKLNRTDDPAHLHTNFSLSAEGETVVLCDATGRLMDRTEYELLKTDVAWVRGADGSWSASTPNS